MADLVFVALGSNLGNRATYLAGARRALAALDGTQLVAESEVEETAPIGPPGQGPYLNQMVALTTTLSPRELLGHLHAIEQQAGRVRTQRWASRTLDLDIVRFDDRTIDEPGLAVPHPELPNRDFWQRELDQLQHQLRHQLRARVAS